MTANLPSRPQNQPVAPKLARKPYVAPLLEDYGPVRELTQALGSYYDGSDTPLYYSSVPL